MDGRFGVEQFEALGIDDSSDGLRAARQVGMLQINLGVAHRIVEADICIRKSREC
jgi:beta-phosphoglucomutase-like phosphatase (HAD superfamily)